MKSRVMAVVAGLGAVGLVVSGCANQAGPAAAPPKTSAAVIETSLQGFDLDTSPAAMIAFPDNKLIIEGTVRDEGARRVVTPKAAGGDLWYVYRPVNLVVTAVHRGDAKVGDVIAVRVIGGEADGHRTVYGHAPEDKTYAVGKKLLVFGAGKLDVGDGVVAVTPNATYVVDGSEATNSAEPHHKISVQGFRNQLRTAAKAG